MLISYDLVLWFNQQLIEVGRRLRHTLANIQLQTIIINPQFFIVFWILENNHNEGERIPTILFVLIQLISWETFFTEQLFIYFFCLIHWNNGLMKTLCWLSNWTWYDVLKRSRVANFVSYLNQRKKLMNVFKFFVDQCLQSKRTDILT